jgi:2',3'-cyclic-nucleotide 2'-phosphodiesterase (5'-nucleotidase family)
LSCSSYQAVYETEQLRVLNTQAADSSVIEIITPYKAELDDEMNEVIGEFATDMSRAKPESPLGNFVCDMLLAEGALAYGAPLDFAVYNYGGIRLDVIGAGPVTRGKIFELLPFENFAVVVNLDAEATLMLIRKITDEKGWPVGGIRFKVIDQQPTEILIAGKPFDPARTYKVIMNDYMATGGDNVSFIDPADIEFMNVTIRDLAIQYIQKQYQAGNKINSVTDGRIRYE